MVEFSPATREARVRFPAGAIFFLLLTFKSNLGFFLQSNFEEVFYLGRKRRYLKDLICCSDNNLFSFESCQSLTEFSLQWLINIMIFQKNDHNYSYN